MSGSHLCNASSNKPKRKTHPNFHGRENSSCPVNFPKTPSFLQTDASGSHFHLTMKTKTLVKQKRNEEECTNEEDKAIGRSLNVWRLQLHSSHNWGLEVYVEDAEHVKRVQNHSQNNQTHFTPSPSLHRSCSVPLFLFFFLPSSSVPVSVSILLLNSATKSYASDADFPISASISTMAVSIVASP